MSEGEERGVEKKTAVCRGKNKTTQNVETKTKSSGVKSTGYTACRTVRVQLTGTCVHVTALADSSARRALSPPYLSPLLQTPCLL